MNKWMKISVEKCPGASGVSYCKIHRLNNITVLKPINYFFIPVFSFSKGIFIFLAAKTVMFVFVVATPAEGLPVIPS